MKMVVAGMMVLLVISSQMDSVESDASDCLDACSTACVQRDARLQARCDRKCTIRCGPDSTVKEDMGWSIFKTGSAAEKGKQKQNNDPNPTVHKVQKEGETSSLKPTNLNDLTKGERYGPVGVQINNQSAEEPVIHHTS
ncbi:hypothetical protein RJT34_13364 [Clitoria ternatea]|uniref:Uncharacterized protein n=1 Tax=Clitoria ternatea TaxID=43366 RepID=A0AAN9JQH9_CLITE